ncbi:hypothetical protein V8E54_014791 [Elaphomyces granulatus]
MAYYPQQASQKPLPRQHDQGRPVPAPGWKGQGQESYRDQSYQDYGYQSDRGVSGGDHATSQTYGLARSHTDQQLRSHDVPQDYRHPQGSPDGRRNQHAPSSRGHRGGDPRPSTGRGERPMNGLPQQPRLGPSRGPPPSSSTTVSWDNPYPNFDPNRQRRGSADTGVQKQTVDLQISDKSSQGQLPARPHTSNSSRSATSRPPHGRHEARDPSGLGISPNDHGRDMSLPKHREPHDASKPLPERPYVNTGGSHRMPPLKRSATTPNSPTAVRSQQPKPQYPWQTTYQEPVLPPASKYGSEPRHEPPPRPSTASGSQQTRSTGNKNADSKSYHASSHHDRYTSDDFLAEYFEPPENEGDDLDMPNFDAIPDSGKKSHRRGTSLDFHLAPESKQQAPTGPTSTRSDTQYAAYKPELDAQAPHPESQPNQFENAGFQFGLPSNPSQGRQLRQNGSSSRVPPTRVHSDEQGGYGSQWPHQHHGGSIQAPQQPYHINQLAYSDNSQDQSQNPDAVPYHPTPFRPGLDQGPKPPPIRQYDNSNPSATPPPGGPQSVAPDRRVSSLVTTEEIQRLQKMANAKPADSKTHLVLAKKLVEAASVLADENGRVDVKTRNKNREKYIMDGYRIIKKLVHSGYAEAMFYLADCYGQGLLGLEADPKEAYLLYQSAAKQGHAESAYRTAVCCELGQEAGGGTKRDPSRAIEWYKRAATLGNIPAMYKMGIILLKGLLGQPKNPREALFWLKRAAEGADEENPHALHELALLYESSENRDFIIPDEAYSKELFMQAAELGYKFSQFRIAVAYEYGSLGCPVDARQSIIWYTRAAAQGEHQSELALSGWYLTGAEGMLQQSDTEAYLWARKAATAGLAKAEYAMGYFSEVGIGVPSNLDDAKRWYWKAASQNFVKARERLEDLKKGGGRMQKTRVSRSAVSKQNEGDCVVM